MHTIHKSEKTISNTWDKIWKEVPIPDWEQDFISQVVYHAVKNETDGSRKSAMLEAGCGTGRISIKLSNSTTKVTLLDSSMAALGLARQFTSRENKNISFVNNSIYDISFIDNSFDIVWNAGVLEHFLEDEQNIIINEMLRVCKDNGRVIILVPYSRAVFYRLGKWLREKLNLWNLGREVPLKTLKNIHAVNGNLLREYVVGTSEQTFLLPKGFKKITKAFLDGLIWLGLGSILSTLVGGYLLVSVFEKTGSDGHL